MDEPNGRTPDDMRGLGEVDLRWFAALATALIGARHPAEVVATALRAATDLPAWTGAALLVIDDAARTLAVADAVGYPPEVVARWRSLSPAGQEPVAAALRHGEHLVVAAPDDLITPAAHPAGERPATDAGATHCLPLRHDGAALGALIVSLDAATASPALLERMAAVIAAALARARLTAAEPAEAVARDIGGRYPFLFENLADALLIIDQAGRYIDANPAACDLTGYSREELLRLRTGALSPASAAWKREQWRRIQATGSWTGEAEILRKDGSIVLVQTRLTRLLVRGETVLLSAMRDITDRRAHMAEQERRLARSASLAEVSRALGEVGLQVDAVLLTIIQKVAALIGDLSICWLLSDDGRWLLPAAIHHPDPSMLATSKEMLAAVVQPADAGINGAVIQAGRPRRLAAATLDEMRQQIFAGHAAHLDRTPMYSLLTVPLRAHGRIFGTLSVSRQVPDRHYTADDEQFLQELADRAALAVEHARLLAAAQAARAAADHRTHHLARLQAAAAALAGAIRPLDVARVVVDQGRQALGARGGLVALVPSPEADPARTPPVVVYAVEYAATLVAGEPLPAGELSLLAEALRRGEPLYLASSRMIAAALPDAAPPGDAPAHQALAATPLRAEGRLLGLLAFSFDTPQGFPDDDRRFLAAVADQAAVAVRRATLYAESEVGRRRLAFLAEASARLSTSLDEQPIVEQIARLAVPELATWSLVELLQADGTLTIVATAHAEPDKAGLLQEWQRRWPTRPTTAPGVAEVVRTGRARLMTEIGDILVDEISADPERAAMARALESRAALILPLAARGRILGIIKLLSAQPGRPYGADDLALAEEFGRRAALAIDNARLYAQAQAAIRQRDEFLSIAAHELKTPVTGLKGYAQLLRRNWEQGRLAEHRLARGLAAIDQSADRLVTLTADLLDVARIQLGQLALRPEPLDLVKVARTAAERLSEATGAGPRIALRFELDPCPVTGDPNRLEQVLVNLIDNAIKYSPDGGAIEVALTERDGGMLLTVRDEGIGLPAGATEVIFMPFGRADNAANHHIQGMGLGLAICRSIVERHGGRIWAESAGEGQGTTMLVWLPRAEEGGPDER